MSAIVRSTAALNVFASHAPVLSLASPSSVLRTIRELSPAMASKLSLPWIVSAPSRRPSTAEVGELESVRPVPPIRSS